MTDQKTPLPLSVYIEALSHNDFVKILQPYTRPFEVYRTTVLMFMHHALLASQPEGDKLPGEWQKWLLHTAKSFCVHQGSLMRAQLIVKEINRVSVKERRHVSFFNSQADSKQKIRFADFYLRYAKSDFYKMLAPHFRPWILTDNAWQGFVDFVIKQGQLMPPQSKQGWSQWLYHAAQEFGLEYRKARFLESRQ